MSFMVKPSFLIPKNETFVHFFLKNVSIRRIQTLFQSFRQDFYHVP